MSWEYSEFIFLNNFIYLIFGCVWSSLPVGFSLVAESGGYSLFSVHGLIIVVASLVVEHGL